MNSRLEDSLKKLDLRMTSARKSIFKVLVDSNKALSPKDICFQIDQTTETKADHASVYRNLTLFTQIGLVHRFQDGKYSICQHSKDHHHQHMHIVANCVRCGRTQEMEEHPEDICQLAKQLKGFIHSFQSFSGLTLDGICDNCSNTN